MIEPIIPRAQSLRFVSLVNYWTKPFNHDSRLLQHQGKTFDDILPYCQKVSILDNPPIQLQCDYSSVSIELYDYDETKIEDISATKTELATNWFCYDASVVTSSLVGIYYCLITLASAGKPTYIWQSDYFEVGNYVDYPLIKWRESTYSGLYFGNPLLFFSTRIEADITRAKISTETDTFEVYNSVQVNAKTKSIKVYASVSVADMESKLLSWIVRLDFPDLIHT